jgi:hypothetical protein
MRNTDPESIISSKDFRFDVQNDVHTSNQRNWAYQNQMLDISGWIDEEQNFEAIIFVLGASQPVQGNCKDGYDIVIMLPTAYGKLRLSIEDGGSKLFGRGRVFVTPAPVIDINDVFLGDLSGKASLSCFLQIPQHHFTISDIFVLTPRQVPTMHSAKPTCHKRPSNTKTAFTSTRG